MNDKEIVMYSRTTGCPFVTLAKKVLDDYAVEYREIFIDKDDDARQRVRDWTGFLAVPTIIIARRGEDLPITPPAYLEPGASPRGVNRGAMITEAGMDQLVTWLSQHGFIQVAEDGG